MKVLQLQISNFRGISSGVINLQGHTLIVGAHGSGRTSICEALGLVLSVDALNRHPVVDEYDFYNRQYIDSNNQPIEIRLNVILTDLSVEDRFLFKKHIRAWNDDMHGFADDVDDRSLVGDGSRLHWVLPVVFIARYEQNEQDFITGTFFDYPSALDVDSAQVDQSFGGGRTIFGRAEKRHCGFIFLGPSRNTSKLLSLHSGSLLERILVLGRKNFSDSCEPPPPSSSGSINLESLATGHKGNARLKSFITLPLTAETARYVLENLPFGKRSADFIETIALFTGECLDRIDLPVEKRGTGAHGLLLIELLESLLELKGSTAVNLVIEELEEGQPTHMLVQLVRLILSGINQVITTTNSPIVTALFETHSILALSNNARHEVCASSFGRKNLPIELRKSQHRQLTNAILGQSVFVVDSEAASSAFRAASLVFQKSSKREEYTELGQAGVFVFACGNAHLVPQFGPMFKGMQKKAFAFYNLPAKDFDDETSLKLEDYTASWQSTNEDFEALIISETSPEVHRRFLEVADTFDTYPRHCGTYDAFLHGDDEVSEIAISVLRDRRDCSDDMVGLFIEQCRSVDELPITVRNILSEIHHLTATRF